MPQLWTETFVTQYFWLVVILFGFYYLAVTEIIPQIAFTLKTRKELESNSSSSSTNKLEDNNSKTTINSTKSLLSTILTPVQTSSNKGDNTTNQLKASINTIKTDWVKKYSV